MVIDAALLDVVNGLRELKLTVRVVAGYNVDLTLVGAVVHCGATLRMINENVNNF